MNCCFIHFFPPPQPLRGVASTTRASHMEREHPPLANEQSSGLSHPDGGIAQCSKVRNFWANPPRLPNMLQPHVCKPAPAQQRSLQALRVLAALQETFWGGMSGRRDLVKPGTYGDSRHVTTVTTFFFGETNHPSWGLVFHVPGKSTKTNGDFLEENIYTWVILYGE